MDHHLRMGIGLDTCLLQAADSFLNQVFSSLSEECCFHMEPRAREQFIRAADIFVDTPATFLTTPHHALGHLGQLGKLIASHAVPIPDVTHKCEMTTETGERYYEDFLQHVLRQPSFRELVVHWGWFQFTDYDVLLGYADRMEVPSTSGIPIIGKPSITSSPLLRPSNTRVFRSSRR
jgi:hypothetical protein